MTAVLFVDDEPAILRSLKRNLQRYYECITAESAQEGLEILKNNKHIAVVVSDQDMPNMGGIDFLIEVGRLYPTTSRIMLTGDVQMKTMQDALNKGHLYKYLNKPCDTEEIREAVQEGIEHHRRVAGEKEMLEKTLYGSIKVLTDILALSQPKLFQRAQAIRPLAKELAQKINYPRMWEVDMAVMLEPLGEAMLPDNCLRKHLSGQSLSETERALVQKTPEITRDLLKHIPRLEKISEIVYYAKKGYDGSGMPEDNVRGKDLPVIARIIRILKDVHAISGGERITPQHIARLYENQAAYDDEFIKLLKENVMNVGGRDDEEMLTLTLQDLQAGDRLMQDIRSHETDKLLLAQNFELTETTVRRLQQYAQLERIDTMIRVKRKTRSQHNTEREAEHVA